MFTKPIKGDEAAVELVEKYTPEGEIILPKGTTMTGENAIIVPKEKWEQTSIWSSIPDDEKDSVVNIESIQDDLGEHYFVTKIKINK